MAFYASDTSPGRGRPVTRRWSPGQPYFWDPKGTVYYLPKDLNPASPGAALARQLAAGRSVPSPYTGRQPGTPNPYGIGAGTMSQQNQGQFYAANEGREYIGGYPDDYASSATVAVPYGSDNLSLRYHYYQKRPPTKQVYGRPIYREGEQFTFPGKYRQTVDDIRRWQAFFQANGFKTGPSGLWTEFEQNAMRSFMGMANGVPGGGMSVFVLRDRVQADLASGAMAPGTLAAMLNTPATGQNELAPGGEGVGDELAPYTTTQVDKEITQYSTDQAMNLLRSELAQQVGRRPTDKELATYVKGLNSALRADPTVITQVVRTDPGAGTVDRTVTRDESSVDPQARAAEFAISGVPEEEREGYQENRYLDALMAELGF
jgi:hypothetical protein